MNIDNAENKINTIIELIKRTEEEISVMVKELVHLKKEREDLISIIAKLTQSIECGINLFTV